MDRIHRALGMKMFGYHYMIYRDGTIHAGRPERAFSCDIEVVTQAMHTNRNLENESPFDFSPEDLEVESATNVISSGRIFICLEGHTEASDITLMQRNSLIELSRDIKERNRNVRGIYSLSEIIPVDNLGIFVDMNTIRSEINSSLVPVYVDTPVGGVSYTYGGRELVYNPENPLSGNDVRLVQLYLRALNIPLRSTNAIYDLFTFRAIKEFQKIARLEITGNMDEENFRVLQEKVRELSVVRDFSQYHRLLYYKEYNMMSGRDVSNLQSNLARLRYLEQTDEFDKQTMEGVKRFQYDAGLEQDGVVGPITWRMIMDTIGVEFERTIVYNPDDLVRGNDVRFIQRKIALMARRFGIVTYSSNGVYDEITFNNVRKIQSQINFPIDGIINEKMFDYFAQTERMLNNE